MLVTGLVPGLIAVRVEWNLMTSWGVLLQGIHLLT